MGSIHFPVDEGFGFPSMTDRCRHLDECYSQYIRSGGDWDQYSQKYELVIYSWFIVRLIFIARRPACRGNILWICHRSCIIFSSGVLEGQGHHENNRKGLYIEGTQTYEDWVLTPRCLPWNQDPTMVPPRRWQRWASLVFYVWWSLH